MIIKRQWRRDRGGGGGGGGGLAPNKVLCSHDTSLVRHGTVRLLIIWDCVAAVTIASYNQRRRNGFKTEVVVIRIAIIHSIQCKHLALLYRYNSFNSIQTLHSAVLLC